MFFLYLEIQGKNAKYLFKIQGINEISALSSDFLAIHTPLLVKHLIISWRKPNKP